MKPRSARRPLAAKVLLAVGVAALAAGSARAADAWLPLAIGNEWVYRGHYDRVFQPGDGPTVRSFSLGTSREWIVSRGPAPGAAAAPAFRVQVETQERRLDGPGERRERRDRFFSAGPEGAFLHHAEARAGNAAAAMPQLSRRSVQILPAAPKPGQRWRAGRLVVGDLKVDLEGEVLIYEDVEVGGQSYPKCLHVRLVGTPSGFAAGPTGRGRVTGGRMELEFWLARGVGIVKDAVRTDLDLVFEGEVQATTSSIAVRRLEGFAPAP